MYGLTVTNGASAGYVLMFDATTVPGDGAVSPVGCYAIPAGPSRSQFHRSLIRGLS